MKDIVYSQKDLKSLKIFTNDYEFNMSQIGVFEAVLDLKAETPKKDLRVFFSFADGRKIIATVHWWQKYLNCYEIPTGTKVNLTYERNSKGGIYLTKVDVIE